MTKEHSKQFLIQATATLVGVYLAFAINATYEPTPANAWEMRIIGFVLLLGIPLLVWKLWD